MEELVSLVRSAQAGDAEAYSLMVSRFWENDPCWDNLRDREQFRRLFTEKRRQPIW